MSKDTEAMGNPLALGLRNILQGVFVRSGFNPTTGQKTVISVTKVQPVKPEPMLIKEEAPKDETPRNLLVSNTDEKVEKAKGRKK